MGRNYGVPEEDLDKLFKKGARPHMAESKRRRSGLSLTLHGLVETRFTAFNWKYAERGEEEITVRTEWRFYQTVFDWVIDLFQKR